jgi:hypothetical protein
MNHAVPPAPTLIKLAHESLARRIRIIRGLSGKSGAITKNRALLPFFVSFFCPGFPVFFLNKE